MTPSFMFPGRRFALAALLLALAAAPGSTPGRADTAALKDDPEMTCNSAPVQAQLAERLPQLLCLENLSLNDLTLDLRVTQQELTLADLITTALSEVPLRRSCEAQLSFAATVEAEALGPAPGIALKLLAKGEPRTVTYAVGRYDDGRLYLRLDPGCWKIDSLQPPG
jgi:hypothetical protein